MSLLLSSGSLVVMQRTTQHFWQHQISKTTKSIAPRLNLAFRIVR
nr:hypothetical protein [Adhaeribacter aquaticus]